MSVCSSTQTGNDSCPLRTTWRWSGHMATTQSSDFCNLKCLHHHKNKEMLVSSLEKLFFIVSLFVMPWLGEGVLWKGAAEQKTQSQLWVQADSSVFCLRQLSLARKNSKSFLDSSWVFRPKSKKLLEKKILGFFQPKSETLIDKILRFFWPKSENLIDKILGFFWPKSESPPEKKILKTVIAL